MSVTKYVLRVRKIQVLSKKLAKSQTKAQKSSGLVTHTGEWEIGAVSRRVGIYANGVKTRVLEKFQNGAQDKKIYLIRLHLRVTQIEKKRQINTFT